MILESHRPVLRLAGQGHLEQFLLLLANVLVKTPLHSQRQQWHLLKLQVNLFELRHFLNLPLSDPFLFQLLFPLFDHVLSHLEGLLKVLVAVLEDLLQGLLVEDDHALLVLK